MKEVIPTGNFMLYAGLNTEGGGKENAGYSLKGI
jgi:hypothetical protein